MCTKKFYFLFKVSKIHTQSVKLFSFIISFVFTMNVLSYMLHTQKMFFTLNAIHFNPLHCNRFLKLRKPSAARNFYQKPDKQLKPHLLHGRVLCRMDGQTNLIQFEMRL